MNEDDGNRRIWREIMFVPVVPFAIYALVCLKLVESEFSEFFMKAVSS